MIALCKSKLIDGVYHHLYEIEDGEDLSSYPWIIPHEGNQYWVPITIYASEYED